MTTAEPASASEATRRMTLWGALFIFNMFAIAAARIFDIIEPPVPWILMLANFALLIPYIRAAKERMELKGAMSPALRRYNKRILLFGLVYMVAMIAGGNAANAVEPDSPVLWAVAIVPLLPALGMVWAMASYLREEQDEYLRHRAINAALAGLGLVLVAGTAWGFLEMFGLLPHIWAWWVFPVFAIGLGIGMCWPRGGGGAEE